MVVYLNNEKYAFEIEKIREISRLPQITPAPNVPKHVRGIINMRGNVIPVIDIRMRLGFRSFDEEANELISMLKEREKDHKNWLQELENSVLEDREFKLTTDPHACKFGIWYDNYHTDYFVVSHFLEKFDTPHQRIHKTAIKIARLRADYGTETALKAIDEAKRTELKQMQELFKEFYSLIRTSNKELALIFESNGELKAATVDKVDRIINFSPKNLKQVNSDTDSTFLEGIIKLDNEVIILLNNDILN